MPESYEHREPWHKGKLAGQKAPLEPKDIWAIRIQHQNAHHVRDLAMFNLAIASKRRGCDLVCLRVRDVTHGSQMLSHAIVIQRKAHGPVQFELTEPTRTTEASVRPQLSFTCNAKYGRYALPKTRSELSSKGGRLNDYVGRRNSWGNSLPPKAYGEPAV